jgi:hypothetical protein
MLTLKDNTESLSGLLIELKRKIRDGRKTE